MSEPSPRAADPAGFPARLLAASIDDDWVLNGPLQVNCQVGLDVLTPSVILVNARRLLAMLEAAGGGLPILDSGRFEPGSERAICAGLWWGDGSEVDIPSEVTELDEPRPVALLRAALEATGATERRTRRLVITQEGLEAMAPQRAALLYAKLLRWYFGRNRRGEAEDGPLSPSFWASTPAVLWGIGTLDPRCYDTVELIRTIFPPPTISVWADAQDDVGRETVAEWIQIRVLEPLLDFALLQRAVRDHGRSQASDRWCWRRGPLFDRLIRFDFERDAVGGSK